MDWAIWIHFAASLLGGSALHAVRAVDILFILGSGPDDHRRVVPAFHGMTQKEFTRTLLPANIALQLVLLSGLLVVYLTSDTRIFWSLLAWFPGALAAGYFRRSLGLPLYPHRNLIAGLTILGLAPYWIIYFSQGAPL